MAEAQASKDSDFAVIETGSKQYLVRKGDTVVVERLDGEDGDNITFDKVLFTSKGGAPTIGAPLVKGAKVVGKVKKQTRAPKLEVLRFKAKSRYHKRKGHRQHQTLVTIESL